MLLDDLKARIESEGLVASGFTVFLGFLPDTPDQAIVLYETGGAGPERFLGGAPSVEQPGLQVVTRGGKRDYATPRTQIETLYQAMMDWSAFVQGGTRYLGLTPLQAPFPFDRDGNERVKFSVNFLVQKELS